MSSKRGMAVEVKDLCKHFCKGDEVIKVIEQMHFAIDGGSSVSILGASGAGKSTLLNVLGGLDRPTSGTVKVGEHNVQEKSDLDLANFRSECIGFVFQFHHLLKDFSAEENVAMPLLIAGERRGVGMKKARELLAKVGLQDRCTHRPGELSGGEQQRVAIARAMVNKPSVLLADEPTGNLDRNNGEQILRLLFNLNAELGCTLIIVTHDQQFASWAEQTVWMRDGKIFNTSPAA